jgi:hypothetical protein
MKYRALLIGCFLGFAVALCIAAQDRPNASIPTVDFCDLIKNPAAYANKTIRLKAILLENQTPRVDGGDPILYDSRCQSSDFSVTVTFSETFKTNTAYETLRRIRGAPDEADNSRAVVTLVGEFQYSGQREYGHLDWANSQVLIHEIESVSPIKASAKP